MRVLEIILMVIGLVGIVDVLFFQGRIGVWLSNLLGLGADR